MTDKQTLRNALTEIEDKARANRLYANDSDLYAVWDEIARLVQIIRQDIVQ